MAKTHKQREIERAASAGPVVGLPLSGQAAHNALMRRVAAWLALTGVPFRVVVTGSSSEKRPTYGRDRLVDVVGAIPPTGRLFALELKTGKGVATSGQKDFFDAFDAAGALCLEIRDMNDLGPLERAIASGKQLREKIASTQGLADPRAERAYLSGAQDARRPVGSLK